MTEPPSVQVTGGKALHVSRIDSGASKSESHDESTPGAVRERKRRADAGLRDEAGREASPVTAGIDKDEYGARVSAKLGGRTEIPPPSGYQVFAPTIDTFLKEHLFCDIFIRDNLTHKRARDDRSARRHDGNGRSAEFPPRCRAQHRNDAGRNAGLSR